MDIYSLGLNGEKSSGKDFIRRSRGEKKLNCTKWLCTDSTMHCEFGTSVHTLNFQNFTPKQWFIRPPFINITLRIKIWYFSTCGSVFRACHVMYVSAIWFIIPKKERFLWSRLVRTMSMKWCFKPFGEYFNFWFHLSPDAIYWLWDTLVEFFKIHKSWQYWHFVGLFSTVYCLNLKSEIDLVICTAELSGQF